MLFSKKVLVPSICIVAIINLLSNPFVGLAPAMLDVEGGGILADDGGAGQSNRTNIGQTTEKKKVVKKVVKSYYDKLKELEFEQEKIMKHRLPNVLLIGTEGGGTTPVSDFIFDEVGACGPIKIGNDGYYNDDDDNKRISGARYFDKLPTKKQVRASKYELHFEHCKRNVQYILDSTPTYLRYAERVHTAYEQAAGMQHTDLKIIVILREPIERELYMYNHYLDRYKNTLTKKRKWNGPVVLNKDGSIKSFNKYFETITREEINPSFNPQQGENTRPPPTNLGMYAYHLKQWFKYFQRRQILILNYDELIHSPGKTMLRVSQFLGREGYNPNVGRGFEDIFKEHDRGIPSSIQFQCNTLERLKKEYEPFNNELQTLLESNAQGQPTMEQRPIPAFVPPTDCSASS